MSESGPQAAMDAEARDTSGWVCNRPSNPWYQYPRGKRAYFFACWRGGHGTIRLLPVRV